MRKATVQKVTFPAGRRVLAVSDIHGNLAFLKGLLEKVAFSPEDILVLVGDLLEKGPESLATLRCCMELGKTHTVYALRGNCDDLLCRYLDSGGERDESFFRLYYEVWGEKSLLAQMAAEAGLPLRGPEDLAEVRRQFPERFPEEVAYLRAMPTILESEDCFFVHGGIPREDRLEELDAWGCMKNDDFLGQGRAFSKWVIVGHWPVTLYRADIPSAAPIILPERKIASIDGGCVLKADGQLNALILEDGGRGAFSWLAYDGLPVMVAGADQAASEDPVNIRWGRDEVEVLEEGPELTLCRHLETGRVLPILNDYLYRWNGKLRCEDSTDYRLPVTAGERLAVVRRLSDRALVKKKGVTGWYFGPLKPADFVVGPPGGHQMGKGEKM